MQRKEIKLSWSNKEQDWSFNYPDSAGGSLAGVFFDMTKTTGHRTDWQQSLIAMLIERGYDYKTLKITCKKIK